MSHEIVIRPAREEDLQQRIELIRHGFSSYFWDAFLFFFFQELTLECCVLGAAVLFIFCGASAAACLSLLPAAALLVAVAVAAANQGFAYKHSQSIRREIFGLVAEMRGALLVAPGPGAVPITFQLNLFDKNSAYSQVVGTVSVSEYWGPHDRGWLHSLVVHPDWRGRGVGRALAAGARTSGAGRGLSALEAAASQLQGAARAALHAAGWEVLGSYERSLCGAALTLPLVRLAADLPLA